MKLITFITLLLLGTSSWAVGTQKIAGYAGETTGGVAFAFNKLGQKRKLAPQTPVYEGETLITSKTASSSVIFTDGTTIELNPSTQFRVEKFRFGKQEEESSAVFRMLKGGFRFISGLVNKQKGGNLTFRTATATIGVRGSAGEITEKSVVVFEGTFTVASSSGSSATLNQGDTASTDTQGVKKTERLTKSQLESKLSDMKEKQNNLINQSPGMPVQLIALTQGQAAADEARAEQERKEGEVERLAEQIRQAESLLNNFNNVATGGGSEASIETTCQEGQVLVEGKCITPPAAGGDTGVEETSPSASPR